MAAIAAALLSSTATNYRAIRLGRGCPDVARDSFGRAKAVRFYSVQSVCVIILYTQSILPSTTLYSKFSERDKIVNTRLKGDENPDPGPDVVPPKTGRFGADEYCFPGGTVRTWLVSPARPQNYSSVRSISPGRMIRET